MALRSKCSFININKRRSDRQSSVTRTGETKARQIHQQGQCNGRGRWKTERISQGRQGQKGRQQMVSRENSPGNNREIHIGETLGNVRRG